PTAGLLRSVFWLVVELTADGPLVIVVDDAHWADEISLRALAYVARRRLGLPATILLAARGVDSPGTPGTGTFLVIEGATALRLPPLTVDGTRALLHDLVADSVDEAASASCH